MPTSDPGLDKTLSALGLTQASEVAARFAELRAHFDAQLLEVHDEAGWKRFRDTWLGRKSGVLTQITGNWLKPAAPESKPAVGAALNALRAHVESQVRSEEHTSELQ